MFSAAQVEQLSAKLSAGHVKTRQQAGRNVSYVEGWHAIAEANRIFGFDAWTRETFETKCVSERERTIGKPPYEKPGWGVSYIAKVRVTAGGVIREGIGAGHGIDADLGQAHESAIKEAETDAMKRALMTFGNPFGLALYDKTQADVEAAPVASVARKEREPAPPVPPVSDALKRSAVTSWAKGSIEKMHNFIDYATFDKWANDNAAVIASVRKIDEKLHDQLVAAIRDRYVALEKAPA